MARVSRIPVKATLSQELDEQFAFLISSLSSSKDIESFFQEFLTKEEKVMLTKRLMLHLLLERGYRTSEIAAVLGITRETVRVHKQLWDRGGAIYRNIVQKLAQRRRTREFWQKIDAVLEPLALALRAKSNIQARRKFEMKAFEE